ncbi:MAG: DegV family EDD domain-containing protein, partial [Clostridia bacterium]|nr:DegV family EDD domain-containing protein [Clostridia bacterium]
MQKIAIMTDTNSGISPKYAKENGIFLLQMPFFVDGEEFLEYGSIYHDEFFARMTAGAEVSTSQPSPGALCELWEKILESYETIIYIPMSSALSGTYQTAKMLANDYDDRVLVVDNKRISVTLR